MIAAALFVSACLIGMAGITLSNLALFPRLGSRRYRVAEPFSPGGPPFVSVLIPARDEAAVIGDAVRRLLAQTYPRFELLVLDDSSTDGTSEVALAAAAGDGRFRVLSGAALPPGWGGKNWACHQLAQAARGEWLVFTDADTMWEPEGLASLASHMAQTRADLLTVWPTQVTVTWPERLVVPLMAMVVVGYLPVVMTHHSPWSAFAAATGQCMAFRRKAYAAVGGHEALKGEVLEDVKFARRVKALGLRLRMADGNRLVSCRMYRDWASVRDGFAKNILSGYGGSIPALAGAALFHWLVFLSPWGWLALGSRIPDARGWELQIADCRLQIPGWPAWPLALIALGIGLRAVTAWFTRQRAQDALAMPASVVLMTAIAARAAYWQLRHGGPLWKGRVVGR